MNSTGTCGACKIRRMLGQHKEPRCVPTSRQQRRGGDGVKRCRHCGARLIQEER